MKRAKRHLGFLGWGAGGRAAIETREAPPVGLTSRNGRVSDKKDYVDSLALGQVVECQRNLAVRQGVKRGRGWEKTQEEFGHMSKWAMYTYPEAGRVLGVSRQRVEQLVRSGVLGTVRQGGRVFVSGASLDMLVRYRAERNAEVQNNENR